MKALDWIVLSSTLLFIVVYGIWKTRKQKDMKSYLLGDKDAKWFTVALSIMATQASAITFLSAPGQAFTDGMRFVQFYFGLPLAMIVLSAFVVPIYHKLNVFTAYEYLEKRFSVSARVGTAFLFLIQRGLAAGFTIFAPSLILSSLLGWDINLTNLIIGIIVIVYTVSGGTKAVSQTQKLQMFVIFVGMTIAGVMVVQMIPESVSFNNAMHLAGHLGRLNAVELEFDPSSKYNIWSGIIGGFFLAMSYFGTDQSQVQRYLTAKSIGQSRLGLLFNGMIKIPMQFLILFIGAMLYVFYIFQPAPLNFNKTLVNEVKSSEIGADYQAKELEYQEALGERQLQAIAFVDALEGNDLAAKENASAQLKESNQKAEDIRKEAKAMINENLPSLDTNDTNYIFLNFVTENLPAGLVGLLIAVIISASMSSTSSELNALASTTVVDLYKRLFKPEASEKHYLNASRFFTIAWGVLAIIFTFYANRLGSLIEAVNVLGSLVYGTILGIFTVAFFLKHIGSKEVLIGAVLSEAIIIYCFFFTDVPFLWYNVIGCLTVVGFSIVINKYLELSRKLEK
ncbi:sodium:solute symporter [Sediminitomix flava]|uniref:SSS family transporter n=1 Tax=Sediminitomix flava TaxID=379075 RepID=A0A315Z7X5_SEDFL|nr:sodium:solute symporter [Sediminitomix flava]PWJ41031.1 SSS family transporter [Sediminitomix flava]